MKKRVAELEGAELDYWVARANPDIRHEVAHLITIVEDSFRPSRDWDEGGPIIEREHISLVWAENATWTCDWSTGWPAISKSRQSGPWFAWKVIDPVEAMARGMPMPNGPTIYKERGDGSTLLLAAMRCYVAVKFGEELE